MTDVSQSIVASSAQWSELLRALAARPETKFLGALSEPAAQGIVVAPAAIARWIALRAPDLAERPSLRLLVVGAEKLDAVDGGRWYRLIPALLGSQQAIEVTLVGDRLESEFRSPASAFAPGAAARRHTGSLAGYLCSPAAHDLAFIFHPGFQKHRGWLGDGSIAALVASGARVVASAYEPEEAEIDRRVVECHGFRAAGDTLSNPFFIELGDATSCIRWGQALWQFGSVPPPLGHVVDSTRMDALERLSRMVMHSIAIGRVPRFAYGSACEFRASDGASRTLIYLFDEFFLDPTDGAVLKFDAGALDTIARVPVARVAAYPQDDNAQLDRALWAAAIKEQVLLGLYEAPLDVAAQGALARSMYASLAARVDALFARS